MTEAKLRAEITLHRPDLRIDTIGELIRGKGVEAVCTDTRTGRQGLWPVAWVSGADLGKTAGMAPMVPQVRPNTVAVEPVKKTQASLF